MSWSWDTTDLAANLVGRTSTALGKITVSEPEQTIKKLAGDIIELALEKFPDDTKVRIRCEASQYPAAPRSPRMISTFHMSIEEYVGAFATDQATQQVISEQTASEQAVSERSRPAPPPIAPPPAATPPPPPEWPGAPPPATPPSPR